MNRAKPNKGEDGRIYADSEGGWYYLVDLLENGNEKRTVSTNALFHAQESAQRYSVGENLWQITLSNVLIIDGRTHQAIALYKKEEGLQEGWTETDPRKAIARQAALREGRSLIEHES